MKFQQDYKARDKSGSFTISYHLGKSESHQCVQIITAPATASNSVCAYFKLYPFFIHFLKDFIL